MQRRLLQPHTRTYTTPTLKEKVFSNMKRVSRGYSGVPIPLFPTMLNAPTTSPSRITSSPFLSLEPSPHHTPTTAPSTCQPPHSQPSPNKVEDLESDLKQIKKTYSTALTKLILRVKKLEKTVKTFKSRRRARIIASEDEDALEDSFKQGRKISDIDEDLNISLVQDEEMTWFQDADAEVQEDTNIQIRRKRRVSTGSGGVSTANRLDSTDDVSTASEIGSTAAEKKKDKGKATMTEPEPEKKSKKQLEQERLDFEEALQENIHRASQEQEKQRVVTKADPTKVIDSSDPSVIRYHVQLNRPRSVTEVRTNMYKYLCNRARYKMRNFKGMTYDDIRPIFEKVWDQVHEFVPMDYELEIPRLKRAGQEVQEEPAKRQRTKEISNSVQEQTDEEPKIDELSQEQLSQMIIIVPKEGMHVEALQTKYPIIGWEVFEDMIKNFDREDLLNLWSLVQERFNSPGLTEDKEKELYIEMKMLFDPDEENLLELQRYIHDPLKWWIYDTYAVHYVSTDRGQDIFMLIEKYYPLTKGLATLILCNKLRMDHHSEMADELLTKIFNIANRPRQ
ncbi:hypothetical protein Tco_0510814 [Tanacetum coccineum]